MNTYLVRTRSLIIEVMAESVEKAIEKVSAEHRSDILEVAEKDMRPDGTKALEYYRKLWKCLRKAMDDEDNLGCHLNDIVAHLGKSVESQFTYYDPAHDAWCNYFLAVGVKL